MKLPMIIGLPGSILNIDPTREFIPDFTRSTWNTQYETFLIGQLIPCLPDSGKGEEVYKLTESWGDFTDKLLSYDINPPDALQYFGGFPHCLNIAFQNQSVFSETFGNTFGSSDIASKIQGAIQSREMATELEFMTGKRKISGVAGELSGGAEKAMKWTSKQVGKLGRAGRIATKVLSQPGKVDFPTIWKGSSFDASYEINIRLYNPMPKDEILQQYLVVNPLIALSMFVTPWSDDGDFYQWPFMMRFNIAGLVHLKAAYCSSMTVVKGGDVNDIAWNQRAGTVDVRMSINSVYSTCLNFSGKENPKSEINDLRSYRNALLAEKKINPLNEAPPEEEEEEEPIPLAPNPNLIRPAINEEAEDALVPLS